MAEVITMLALSPTMEEGTLVEWTKSEGDKVSEGEIIAEIETDKATMEMESFHDGTILKLLAQKGAAIPVGSPLAIIGDDGEDISDLLADLDGGGSGASSKTKAEEPEEEPADESDADVESADEAEEAVAPEREPAAEKTKPAKKSRPSRSTDKGDRIFVSPLARRMADDAGIDIADIDGSGPNGRIVKVDVEAAIERGPSKAQAPARAAATEAAAEGEEVPLSQMRKTIAKRLGQVWVDTPTFFLTMDIDMANAMSERKRINDQLAAADAGVKISVNDMIIKACAVALERYPAMNVSFQGDKMIQYDASHIGVAVAIEDGLITPTIRNAHQKSLSAISKEIRELAGRAKDKKLKPEEYTGGTFSVSNLGMLGIDHFTAIINPPQAGILACGAVKKVPVVDQESGELGVGTRMKVTLSCDHRAVDGATGAEFLNHVKRLLENPLLLLV